MAIPLQEKHNVETFGNVEEVNKSQFQIKQSKEAFKILSSGLYSDKILAVVREYSANAWDSHKMAGTPEVPFEVHLPNTFEPYFSVKDFGLGLDKDEVIDLFTTYFGSSKRNTNNATGQLGLGSKSAFAYTDQFTITSTKDNVTSVYTCAISEDGEPTVTLIKSTDNSGQKNGLEVYLGVQGKDFKAFKDAALSVYCFYPVRPIIKGEKLDFTESDEVIKSKKVISEDINIYSGKLPFFKSSSRIIQGACSYPIDSTKLPKKYTNLLSQMVFIEVPIGSLNITASREHIEYDKITTSRLTDILEETLKELTKDVKEKFSKVKNKYEAVLLAYETYASSTGRLIDDVDVYKSLTPYQLRSFHSTFTVPLSELVPKHHTTPDGKTYTSQIQQGLAEIKYITHTDLTGRRFFLRNIQNAAFNVRLTGGQKSEPLIIVDDTDCKKFNAKLEFNLKNETRYHTIYFIKPYGGRLKDVMKCLEEKLEGCNTIIKMSSLPEPPKVVFQKSAPVKKSVLQVSKSSTRFTESSIDVNAGGLYVDVQVLTPLKFGSHVSLRNFVKDLTQAGVLSPNEEVYGFQASLRKIPQSNPLWIPFLPEMRKRILKMLGSKTRDEILDENLNHNDCEELAGVIKRIVPYNRLSNEIESLRVEFDKYIKNKDQHKKLMTLLKLLDIVDVKLSGPSTLSTNPQTQKVSIIQSLFDDVLKHYPLIKYSAYEHLDKHFVEYVSLINLKRKAIQND